MIQVQIIEIKDGKKLSGEIFEHEFFSIGGAARVWIGMNAVTMVVDLDRQYYIIIAEPKGCKHLSVWEVKP